jgi:trehalose 6-phosphate synthase/phosphatase
MTASLFDKALSMDRQERNSRHLRDIEFVSTMPSSKWTKNVLRDLVDIKQSSGDGDDENNFLSDSTGEPTPASIGGFLAKEYDSNFSYVNYDALKIAYNATNRRVIIVDFNGTLVVKEPPGKYLKKEILGTSGFKPPAAALQALHDLCADPCNTVFVVSGDAQETLEAAIGSVPGLYLAASNGACYSPPPKHAGVSRKWYSFDLGVDTDAVKQVALPVLSKYTARTNGSFIKLTHSSIGWSYYSSDPEWGAMQSSHLVLELQHVLAKFDVRFVTLKGIVEIVPRRLNKGLIVKKVLREVASRNGGDGVDFILCMGDDVSDEKMFASIYSFISEIDEEYSNVLPSPSVMHLDENSEDVFFSNETPSLKWKNSKQPIFAFTVAVGKKPSHAALYVDDARDVANVLMSMTKASLNILPHRNSWEMDETEDALFV